MVLQVCVTSPLEHAGSLSVFEREARSDWREFWSLPVPSCRVSSDVVTLSRASLISRMAVHTNNTFRTHADDTNELVICWWGHLLETQTDHRTAISTSEPRHTFLSLFISLMLQCSFGYIKNICRAVQLQTFLNQFQFLVLE